MDSLDSGLSVAELKSELPIRTINMMIEDTQQMMKIVNYQGFRSPQWKKIITRNTGTQETRGDEDYKVKLHEITAMATLHRIQKGLKRPALAWNEIPFVTDVMIGETCDVMISGTCDVMIGETNDVMIGETCDVMIGETCDVMIGETCDVMIGETCDVMIV